MKRDWDMIRDMLTRLEELPSRDMNLGMSAFASDSQAIASYHAELLIEAGLVEGTLSRTIGPGIKHFMLRRLTWSGHEFLDSVRSDTVWNKTKKSFLTNGVSMTFDLVKSVATDISVTLIKSGTGIS